MKRGFWHQFGDRSQRLAQEQLANGNGVGVIVSTRDLSYDKAVNYAESYKAAGAEVLIDQQFYVPHFTNPQLASYPINKYRVSVSDLNHLSDRDASQLASSLELINQRVKANAVLAPALAYEAGRLDIDLLNTRLFHISKEVGNALGIPTYATVVLGQSTTTSQENMNLALSRATSLNADGWYYAFEFSPERVPSDVNAVHSCCKAGLTLACTGKPVLHGYAGPMALLSMGFGATGTAVGHSQIMWRFARERWAPSDDQGGGGDAPPRFFSTTLWGTIIYPDEITLLPAALQSEVLVHSPFSAQVNSNLSWPRWEANKHLIYAIGQVISDISVNSDARTCAQQAIDRLSSATNLHGRIATKGLNLRNGTNIYQDAWSLALRRLMTNASNDYDYLSLII